MLNLGFKNYLHKGIVFEDTDVFLKWGSCINLLIKKNGGTKEVLGDSIMYDWGSRIILNGLEVNLSSSISKYGFDRWFSRFNKVEYWAIGDKIAKEEFNRISNHLFQFLGDPSDKDEKMDSDEIYFTWSIGKVCVSLYLFEQHCYKLHFLIKKNIF